MRGPPLALQRALSRRLVPLALALLAVVGGILVLTWIAMRAQVSLAGFLNGESVWSKAQKQAVIELDAYALGGDAVHLRRFHRDYELLQSDRWNRDAVTRATYDRQAVNAAYAKGDMMPAAETGIIFIVRHLSWAPYVKPALADWRASDLPLDQLGKVAAELQAAYATGALSPEQIAHARARIAAINDTIAPMASAFSLKIAQGAEWFGNLMFAGVVTAACLASLLWLRMARRMLAGIRRSEERYRLLFDSAPDAIVIVDENNGAILDANRTAGAWTGRDPQALVGGAYVELFEKGPAHEGAWGSAELRSADGRTRPVEAQSSVAVWGDHAVRQAIIRDASERVANDRERRIASEALASIAEGIIIADPERRLISVNAAVPQITGFTLDNLAEMRLDETRSALDGGALPNTIWEQLAASHHWSGEVLSRRRDGSTYPERLAISTIRDAQQRVLHYVAVFSDISAAKADRRRLEHMASHDSLTGMANRSQFQAHCQQAIERARTDGSQLAVLFIDLDAFKFVNDSYSHAVGDHLLKLVSQRIMRQLRDGDLAGRIGGDEFTVLLPRLAMREDAATLAKRLLTVLSEPFLVDDYEIVVSASIGIAGYPLDGEDAAALIANADAAMYAAKSEERNTWRFYAPTMQADARHRMALATELRQALADDEFHLAYQPSVELRSGRIVAVEALLRWQHPDRGEVLPGEFIPVAESIGLIQRIDEWVVQAVCAQIHAWDAASMPPLRVAINVSARWLSHPGFIESIRHALQAHAVAPGRVVLEITEGAILRLGEGTERTMKALQAMGIGVAIDDFGTGYASMAYLKLPAVAYLKIDRSFVTGLPDNGNDAAITNAMLAMAATLDLTTIAEGIESEAQHDFLVRAGCAEGQGFLYSYPLPPAAIERMLKPQRRAEGVRLRLVPGCRG